MGYTFPFNTCEKVSESGMAQQPYSAIINAITCLIILYFLLKTDNIHSFLLMLSILVFETFHAFSHIIHIAGPIQINITHSLAYCMNISFLNLFYRTTQVFPSNQFLIYMICVVLLDIYSFFHFGFVYYLATSSLIFISLIVYYYSFLPKFIQKSIWTIIAVIVLIIGLFFNESCNCASMLEYYPHFPYHILIELTGMYLFYVICSNFYRL